MTMIRTEVELAACVHVLRCSNAARARLLEAIDATTFGQASAAAWWTACKSVDMRGDPLEAAAVAEEAAKSKAHPASPSWRTWFQSARDASEEYLTRGGLTSDERAEEIVHDLRHAHELRELVRVTRELTGRAEAMRESPEALRKELLERIAPATDDVRRGIQTTREAAHELIERLQAQSRASTPSPWPELDQCVQLTPGSLTILAAATGVGKTVLGIQYARACHAAGAWCLFVGLEMSASANLARVARQEYGCEHRPEMLPRELQAQAYRELLRAVTAIVDVGFRVDWSCDPGQTTDHVAMRSKAMAARLADDGQRLGLIVVDYLGIIEPTGEDARRRTERHELLGEYARRLKALARTLDVPVLAIAQLNREAEKAGTQATRGMIGDSYAVLRHADTVLLLTRPIPGTQQEPGATPILSVQKAREGRPAWLPMRWDEVRERYEVAP